MGRASRAKAERQSTVVNERMISRGRRFYYHRDIVGYQLHPSVSLPSIPNEAPLPLEEFELKEDE